MNRKPDPEMIDDDNPEWTDETAARAVRHDELPAALQRKLRGQQKMPVKVATSIRLSPEVIEYFKRGGKGWQSRIDDALKEHVSRHRP